MNWGLIRRKQSMTTLPLTDWMGSTTRATARALSASKEDWVLMSVLESQQPKPGWESGPIENMWLVIRTVNDTINYI